MGTPVTNIKLGYGGGASIDGAPVLLTGGSLNKALAVPKIEPFGTPNTGDSRMAVQTGYGTWAYSGSVSFDWTLSAVNDLITSAFLVRNHEFDVVISDGNKIYTASDCKFSSVSISASAGALVTGSVEFQTCADFTEAGSVTYLFDQDEHLLVKYWQSGNTGVESFNLTISQNLSPVYLNWNSGSDDDRTRPQYLRAGLWDITLEVTAFTGWLNHTQVNVGPKVINITQGAFESKGFSYGGVSETGAHNYTFKANALANSGATFFSIT